MIRRSTLVFLTCLTALGAPALRPKIAAAAVTDQRSSSSSQVLVAQASGGSAGSALDVGARGEAVKVVQRRLQQSKYYGGPIDGIYGLATRRAVSTFQSDADLEATGRLDDETWQQLQASLSAQPAATAVDSAAPADTVASPPSPSLSAATPTANELPAIEAAAANSAEVVNGIEVADGATADGAEVADSAAADDQASGFSPVFGWGLALIALLASFGIGFFVANRGKSEVGAAEGGEWGEVDRNTGLPLQEQPSTAQTAAQRAIQTTGRSPGLSGSLDHAGGAIAPTASALQTSGQMGESSALTQGDIVEGLIGDLRNPDPASRRKSIWELGQRGNSLAVQPLVDAMVDADSKEKSLLLAALSEIGMRSLKPMNRALAIALKDNNPEVRKNAIRDLTRIYELLIQTSQMLGYAAEDEDPEVRQTATWALEQLNRIRRNQDVDPNMRSFPGSGAKPIDLLSSEASIRRTQ